MVFESLKEPLTDGGPTLRHFPVTNMTLRDYFAGQALAGIVARGAWDPRSDAAESAYEYADAMLKAREVKP